LHDSLTGLPNRALLRERLKHVAHRAVRNPSNVAVLFTDLDHFKRVNDTFGHSIGDELLVAVAQRLSGVLRPGDTLARLSGDEFVIVCEDLDRADNALAVAERVLAAFMVPFELTALSLAVSASVGIAYAGSGETAAFDQLLVSADTAMYEAKRIGGGRHQLIDLRTVDPHRPTLLPTSQPKDVWQ
jgi:diguanylate cyclase (GGDEF)-like protein